MTCKLLSVVLILLMCNTASAQQKGYYRSPAVYKNIVIFTAEGDLWKYDMQNGITSRLTTNPGVETSPAISPDGKQLSFTGQYEGPTELYVMSINGSVPKRLTYDFDNWDMYNSGWTNDGKILYRTSKYSQLPMPQLVKLDPATLSYETLPLSQASQGCYDDAGTLFFTRLPNQGSKTKRYKGGFIEQVWKFDGKSEAVNLTADFDGTSCKPMLYQNSIYFLSDRDGTMNLWSMDKNGKGLQQHTFSKGWDLQSPSIYATTIVYQKGADIWLYDIATGKERMLDISLQSDFDQRKPRWIKSPVNTISAGDISPNGNYAAIISRGRLFVSPSKSDRWVEIIRKSGIRFKEVHFINEKSLAVLSDESGEFEIWKMNADGTDTAKQLTKDTKVLISFFSVSPDGKYIGYNDKNGVMRIVEVATGAIKSEYKDSYGGVSEMSWSANSKFLSFTEGIANQNSQISVVDITTMKTMPLTTARLDSYNPSWSADSSWLYFASDRKLETKVSSPWGPRQPEPYYTETTNLYALQLDSAAKFPFLQKDSWMTDSMFNPAEKKKAVEKKATVKKETFAAKTYNWQKISKQLYQVPVKNGNIGGLATADGFLYWMDNGAAGNEDGAKLMALKIEESKKYEPSTVATGVAGFTVSGNKKKILISFKNKALAIADANGQKVDMEKAKLELENWNFTINPQQDWNEMFADAWRMMRDYFYDRDMHKVDWVKVRKQYEPLLERITDRYELDDLIAQMVGELSALHTFVYGGEKRNSPDQIQCGFLGATLKKNSNGLVISHIYKSDPDYPDFTSPLNRPELAIKEGDIITAVNNVALKNVQDISELLAGKVNVPVKLNLLDKNMKPYVQVVKPFSFRDDDLMRYAEWELERRERVDTLSSNDIGYVHLKAMGGGDMDDFVKQFYPVFDRKGLIIDVRHNFGGNIDAWVLEKLMRKAWMYWQGRAGGPSWNMHYAFRGHMVILCDQVTSSDGEAVTEGFRRLGLGKVIGMRTWGGEIWLSSSNRLVDNGIASAAEFGVFGPEGKWLIEGRGVEPDITVDNLPFETFKGKDAQLEAAIEYLKKKIKDEPVQPVKVPPHPDKSFNYDK
ncbi:S41 family peptidase [Ferruginibacter profundus]